MNEYVFTFLAVFGGVWSELFDLHTICRVSCNKQNTEEGFRFITSYNERLCLNSSLLIVGI